MKVFAAAVASLLLVGVGQGAAATPGCLGPGKRIVGTKGNDLLIENVRGTRERDDLTGDAGPNVLVGGDGNDVLRGGGGNDRLVAGLGDNDLYGGLGDDVLLASGDDDYFFTGPGNDRYIGGAGRDRVDFAASTALFARPLAHPVSHKGTEATPLAGSRS